MTEGLSFFIIMCPLLGNALNASLRTGHWNVFPGSTTFLRLRVLFLTTCNFYLDFSQAPYMHMLKKIPQTLNCLCILSFPPSFLVSVSHGARNPGVVRDGGWGSEEESEASASWQGSSGRDPSLPHSFLIPSTLPLPSF